MPRSGRSFKSVMGGAPRHIVPSIPSQPEEELKVEDYEEEVNSEQCSV